MNSQEYTPSLGSQVFLEVAAMLDFDESSPSRSCVTYQGNSSSESHRQRATDFCTTGCSVIDQQMNGGIPACGVTEIWGESSSAKTQFCLQLALTSQLSKTLGGLESGVLYIYTHGELPTARLLQLANYFRSKFNFPGDPMQNIFVEKVFDEESLLYVTREKLAKLNNVRLVIIDSIADLFRGHLMDSRVLYELSTYLRRFSEQRNAAIVVTNQASFSPAQNQNVPFLGSCWTDIVTTRIQFLKSPRKMKIDFSPLLPRAEIPFLLLDCGIQGNQ